MRLLVKFILVFLMFAGFLFFYSDGIQKTNKNAGEDEISGQTKSDCPCEMNDNTIKKQDVENPDYVPSNCGKYTGNKNDYWHQDIVGDRECYFGKNIKKQN